MKNKLNFTTYKTQDGVMYPFRLKLEGYNLRRVLFTSGLKYGYAISESELGFDKSWERSSMLLEIKKLINEHEHLYNLQKNPTTSNWYDN